MANHHVSSNFLRDLITINVNGTARRNPAGPRRNPQTNSETKTTYIDIWSPLLVCLGNMTLFLMGVNKLKKI